MDAYGIVWFSQDVEAGMQIINVSTLQKGSYILKATNRETSSILSGQLSFPNETWKLSDQYLIIYLAFPIADLSLSYYLYIGFS
jgi:hypothetical protein